MKRDLRVFVVLRFVCGLLAFQSFTYECAAKEVLFLLPPIRTNRSTDSSTEIEELPAPELRPPVAVRSIEELIEGVERERLLLKQDLENTLRRPKSPSIDENKRPGWLAEIETLLKQVDSRQKSRAGEINKQINALDELLKTKLDDEGPPSEQAIQASSAKPLGKRSADEISSPTGVEGESLPESGLSSEVPQAIVPEAVDRLSLADSLFGKGDYRMALQIYTRLKPEVSDPTDQLWIEYQLASCRRSLGDIQEAEKSFRIVAGAKHNEFLSSQARWWLDMLEQHKTVQERMEQMDATISSLGQGNDNSAD